LVFNLEINEYRVADSGMSVNIYLPFLSFKSTVLERRNSRFPNMKAARELIYNNSRTQVLADK
jgi:hypothetical protein